MYKLSKHPNPYSCTVPACPCALTTARTGHNTGCSALLQRPVGPGVPLMCASCTLRFVDRIHAVSMSMSPCSCVHRVSMIVESIRKACCITLWVCKMLRSSASGVHAAFDRYYEAYVMCACCMVCTTVHERPLVHACEETECSPLCFQDRIPPIPGSVLRRMGMRSA